MASEITAVIIFIVALFVANLIIQIEIARSVGWHLRSSDDYESLCRARRTADTSIAIGILAFILWCGISWGIFTFASQPLSFVTIYLGCAINLLIPFRSEEKVSKARLSHI